MSLRISSLLLTTKTCILAQTRIFISEQITYKTLSQPPPFTKINDTVVEVRSIGYTIIYSSDYSISVTQKTNGSDRFQDPQDNLAKKYAARKGFKTIETVKGAEVELRVAPLS